MTLESQYPIKTICAALELPRSTFYHRATEAAEGELRVALRELAGQYPTYGYRRLTALLQRAGWTVNHKRVQRLMVDMSLQRPLKRRKTRTTNSQHDFLRYPNLVSALKPSRPEEVWVADITYVRLASEPFAGSPLDPDRAEAGAGRPRPGDSPQ
jgi:transposase InsO family protein